MFGGGIVGFEVCFAEGGGPGEEFAFGGGEGCRGVAVAEVVDFDGLGEPGEEVGGLVEGY